MLIKQELINKDEGSLEVKIVPIPGSFIIQISSDILRGVLVMDCCLEKEDMDDLNNKIFSLIDEISMRSFADENEIPQ